MEALASLFAVIGFALNLVALDYAPNCQDVA